MNKKLNLMKINEKELKKVNGGGYHECACACTIDPDFGNNTISNYAQSRYNPWLLLPDPE